MSQIIEKLQNIKITTYLNTSSTRDFKCQRRF